MLYWSCCLRSKKLQFFPQYLVKNRPEISRAFMAWDLLESTFLNFVKKKWWIGIHNTMYLQEYCKNKICINNSF